MTTLLLLGTVLAIGHPTAWLAALATALLVGIATQATTTPLVASTSPDSDTILAQAINIKEQIQLCAGAADALTGGGGKLGAFTPISGIAFVTKAGVDAMTLATPLAGPPSLGGNDGLTLTVIDTTGNAHTITTAANIINGNKHIATFNGTLGSLITLRAYNGNWIATATSGVALS